MANFKSLVEQQRAYFNSGRTKSVSWRREQLQALITMLENESDAFCDALQKDLRKPKNESLFMEVNMTRNDAVNALDNVEQWSGPQRVKKNLLTMADNCFIQPEPYGVTLIIGAWNYPVQLTLLPLVGAIAAGNCCVLKPSELAEEVALVLERVVPKYMDKQAFAVVNGGVPETQALLAERWDFICYTGNNVVAKIIYEAAAKHLTPVMLELGGKSPVYVDPTSDIDLVSRRILWGKFTNCGQTCIAPDFVMCNKSVQDQLVERMKVNLKLFYGENAQNSDSLGRIINGRHFQRVKNLTTSGRIAIGGTMDEKDNYIEPTVLVDCKPDEPAMTEEIFGPVLPMMVVNNEDEAIKFINSREKPLALYVFSNNQAVTDKFLSQTSSGGVTVNDTVMHASLDTLPFGGVGHSGMGGYHGKFSFDAFSHNKPCMLRKQGMEAVNALRYPPYTQRKANLIKWVMSKNPRKRGVAGFLPIMIAGMAVAFVLKMLGFDKYIPAGVAEYIPQYLKK